LSALLFEAKSWGVEVHPALLNREGKFQGKRALKDAKFTQAANPK
jgi:hypothetical protein